MPQPPARATLDEAERGVACFFVGEDACSGDRVYRFVDFKIQSGDRLWLPETWARAWELDGDGEPSGEERTYYRADGEPFSEYHMPDGSIRDGIPWRSPATMPKWAARIWLTVTEVRLQRLQDISEEDARAEGCRYSPDRTGWQGYRLVNNGAPLLHQHFYGDEPPDWMIDPIPAPKWHGESALQEFPTLWNSIHGAGAWDSNLWVAAITFTADT